MAVVLLLLAVGISIYVLSDHCMTITTTYSNTHSTPRNDALRGCTYTQVVFGIIVLVSSKASAIGGAWPPLFGLMKREKRIRRRPTLFIAKSMLFSFSQVLLLKFAMGVGYKDLVLMKGL